MSDESNLPPGVSQRDLDRQAGEEIQCDWCGHWFAPIDGNELCPKCRKAEDRE